MPNTTVFLRSSQVGRTLIELVIAMTIGLVIVIGVSSLYLSSSGLSRTSNQISTAEQGGQLALLLIGDSMKRAAYGEIIGSDYASQGQTLMDGVHLAGCTGTTFTDPFPAYVAPPAPQTPPDLNCTGARRGRRLHLRSVPRGSCRGANAARRGRGHFNARLRREPSESKPGVVSSATARGRGTGASYRDQRFQARPC